MRSISPVVVSTDNSHYYHMAVPRELAERLVERYADDPEVRSVPDALRKAGREAVGREW